ncbi:MAG: hypothetical protein EZS28_022669 [Streblomastix strix]|uniref:Uncharacterized protein n=1 Tax=Streblomastix strix TaxID=222440 RepID=A0A5J4VGX2_9EUKA|nr:MAG: hypothetical protein EZS28_022669 [Streblomastix strix]
MAGIGSGDSFDGKDENEAMEGIVLCLFSFYELNVFNDSLLELAIFASSNYAPETKVSCLANKFCFTRGGPFSSSFESDKGRLLLLFNNAAESLTLCSISFSVSASSSPYQLLII